MVHDEEIQEEPRAMATGRKTSTVRSVFSEALEIGAAVALALIVWELFIFRSGTSTPAVVVLSGSMEPGIKRGDVLLLRTVDGAPVRAGEIVVFKLVGREIPVVHRVLKVHEHRTTGDVEILTKGDHNPHDDVFLYGPDRQWIQRKDLLGRVVWFIPYVGHITLLLSQNKQVKCIVPLVIGLLILLAWFSRQTKLTPTAKLP